MGTYDSLAKAKGQTKWEYTHEYTTETIQLQRNGAWRYEQHNGGERGAWEELRSTVETLTDQQAVNRLRQWGVDEDELAQVKQLEPYLTASDHDAG